MFTKSLMALTICAGLAVTAHTNAAAPAQSDAVDSITALKTSAEIVAREAGSRGRGRGRDDARGHGHSDADACDPLLLAREASEAPRGQDNERAGDRHRRNRGGRNRG